MTPSFTRRGALALVAAAAVVWRAGPATAATESEAVAFVKDVVAEVEALVKSGRPVADQASDFRKLFVRRAASEQAVRFVMGLAWRDMSADQQKRMHAAFLDHIARVYAELLSDYSGQTIELGQAQDFGKKGILVHSYARGGDTGEVSVEWLVSDRGGNGLQLVDITIVGISLLQSQRQEFAAMLEKRGGNVDTLIHDLATG